MPRRNRLLKKLFAFMDGAPYTVLSPFHCAYGKNIYIGKSLFANYNCIIMDHDEVHIWDNVLIAPNVTLTTVAHPMNADERRVGPATGVFEPDGRGNKEYIAPITIGNDVWLCTGTIVCAGVTIGENTVIGAGSVVTRDIPPNVFACGSPCRVVREIAEARAIGRGSK